MSTRRFRRLGVTALLAILVPASASAGSLPTVFVTSVEGPGDLGAWPLAGTAVGLDAGDAICRALADIAGLPGSNHYRAWLSTSTVDAYCHVQGFDARRADNCAQTVLPNLVGGWWRTDGVPFAASPLAMTGLAGAIFTPPDRDESGDMISSTANHRIWTGTLADGTAAAGTCSDWQAVAPLGLAGNLTATTQAFTDWSSSGACGNQGHLLCLQQAAGPAFPSWPAASGLAFVTSAIGPGRLANWTASGGLEGIAAGDRICRSLAAAAGLPGAQSFRAWLSTGAAPAPTRFVGDGPWQRVDGPLVAADFADLRDGRLATPINVTETGAYLPTQRVFTGTTHSGTATPARCGDWTSLDGAGTAGLPNFSGGGWSWFSDVTCATPVNLYCLTDSALILESGLEAGLFGWSAAEGASEP